MSNRMYSRKAGRRVSRRRRRSSRKLHKRRSRHHRGGGLGETVGEAKAAVGNFVSARADDVAEFAEPALAKAMSKASEGYRYAKPQYEAGVAKIVGAVRDIPVVGENMDSDELTKLVNIILGAVVGGGVFGGLTPAALSGMIVARGREIAQSLPQDSEAVKEMLEGLPDAAFAGILSNAPLTSKALGKTVGLAGAAGTYALGGDVLDSLAVGGVAGAGSQYLGKKFKYGEGDKGIIADERERRIAEMGRQGGYAVGV